MQMVQSSLGKSVTGILFDLMRLPYCANLLKPLGNMQVVDSDVSASLTSYGSILAEQMRLMMSFMPLWLAMQTLPVMMISGDVRCMLTSLNMNSLLEQMLIWLTAGSAVLTMNIWTPTIVLPYE